MTILLLGSTGRTGKWILEEALEQGHHVHVLVRDRDKLILKNERLLVFEGLPNDEAALKQALAGCEAVISALNISRISDFPWSRLRTPLHLLSDTIRTLIPVCESMAIRRIIICSAWGVAETKAEIPGWFRWFIDHSNIGPAYADHEQQEKLLKHSSLEWTCVRPTGLTNGKRKRPVCTVVDGNTRPKLTISRRDLARFMVEQLQNRAFVRKAVTVSH